MSNLSLEKSGKTIYFRLFGYIRNYWYVFLLAILANIAYAYIDAKFVSSIRTLVDDGLMGGDMSILKLAPYFVVGMVLVRSLAGFVSVYCMAWSGRHIVKTLRKELFDKLIFLPAQFFDEHGSGEVIAKLTYNTERLAQVTTDALTHLVRQGGTVVFAIVMMMQINWQLTLIFLVSAPVIGLIIGYATKHFRRVAKKIQNAMGDVTQVCSEMIDGQEVIKTYGAQQYEIGRFESVNEDNRKQSMKFALTKAISVPLVQFVAVIGFAGVLVIASDLIQSKELSPGEFVVLLGFMMLIFKPIKQLTSINSVVQEGITAAHGIFEVIDEIPENDMGKKSLKQCQGHVSINNVSFRYPTAQDHALMGVNLTIEPGQTVALVGRSGSGKSTLAQLLLRFYAPNVGEIQIDDQDIQTFQLASVREQIALVSQNVVLFNDSVRNNIAYGHPEVSDEQVIEAAKRAHAWEFIEKMDRGLHTFVGENGALLSGGQRQRIAIARAFIKDAPILILDEATSALDTESERAIQDALNELIKNKTTLVIAHRLSTIEGADKIVVLEEGKVIEQGTHESLLAMNGAYSHLYHLQFKNG